jgi:transcriptional regulator with XRE-family HTH domain
MTKLAEWMKHKGWRDHQVAKLLKISRVQVSRIRRGKCGCSVDTAKKLAKLSGEPWHLFIVNDAPPKKKAA